MFLFLFISIVSADVILIEQPKEVYSLGDTLNIPVKITTINDIASLFTINLICNGVETEVLREYISESLIDWVKKYRPTEFPERTDKMILDAYKRLIIDFIKNDI